MVLFELLLRAEDVVELLALLLLLERLAWLELVQRLLELVVDLYGMGEWVELAFGLHVKHLVRNLDIVLVKGN